MKRYAEDPGGDLALVEPRAALLDLVDARTQARLAARCLGHHARGSAKEKVTGVGSKRRPSARARGRAGSMASSCARACSRYPLVLYAQNGVGLLPGSRNSSQ